MAFTPKDWRNYPDTATPISEAALEDLEVRVTDYADLISGGNVTDITKPPYNADPTGTADCVAGITSAITAAFAGTTSKTLYAPQGTYKLLSALPWRSGLRLVGDGMWGKTVFKPTGQDPTTTPGLKFISWTAANGTSNASPLDGVEFRDFEVDGSAVTAPPSGVPTSDGFYFEHIRNARFQNVYVHDCGQNGLAVNFAYESVTVTNCYAESNGRLNDGAMTFGCGFYLGSHGADTDEEPVTINGCHAINNKRSNIAIELRSGTAVAAPAFSRGARIVGNYCSGGQVGIGDAGNRGTVISDNTVTGASVAGIGIDNGTLSGSKPGYEGLITGNVLYSNTGDGIRFDHTSTGTIPSGRWAVTSNEIHGNSGHGIAILLNTLTFNDLKCSNNAIHDNNLTGIRIYYGGATNTALLAFGEITSNMVWGNGVGVVAGNRSAIQLDVPATDFRVENNSCFDRTATKHQQFGFNVTATFTGGSVRNNDFRGNIGGMNIGTFISATTGIGSNLGASEGSGIDHPPLVAEVPGVSPWTRAETQLSEILYIWGGTVTNISLAGFTVANTTNVSVLLEPGDTPIITYTSVPNVRSRSRA